MIAVKNVSETPLVSFPSRGAGILPARPLPTLVVAVLLGIAWALDGQFAWAAEPRFEKEIATFTALDRTNPPPQNAVLFVGSSSIRLWPNLARQFPESKVIQRGFGGSHLADSTAYADRIIIPYRPRLILLYAGDNDVKDGKTAEQVLADFKHFVQRIHDSLPETQIAFIAIKPSLARWSMVETMKQANEHIQAFVKQDHRLHFIDIFHPMLNEDGKPRAELFEKDGLHLNQQGYALWAKIVRPYL